MNDSPSNKSKNQYGSINFICLGNTFRSRFAEAYAKSLIADKPAVIKIISSGIEAYTDEDGPISKWGRYLIQQNNLEAYNKPHWTQTSQVLIDESDYLVFMNKDVYETSAKLFNLSDKALAVWDILDLWPFMVSKGIDLDDEVQQRNCVNVLGELMKTRVQTLLTSVGTEQ